MDEGLSYRQAGVDIDTADAAKREMARSLEQDHLSKRGCDSYVIGEITWGERKVVYRGVLDW